MVKEIIIENNDKINFYPLDLFDSEPPEIIINKDVDSNFRIAQIMKYNEYLASEITKRGASVKSFKNFDFYCFLFEMFCVVLDVLVGTLGLVFTEYSSTTSSICVIATTISTFVRNATKKFMLKIEKQQSLLTLAKGYMAIVQDKYNIAIRDGIIDHDEYINMVDDFKKYKENRTKLLNEYK